MNAIRQLFTLGEIKNYFEGDVDENQVQDEVIKLDNKKQKVKILRVEEGRDH